MRQVLASDFLKIRKKMIWFLVVLGPFGVVGLQAVNFFLRYDYLIALYEADLWGGLIENVHYLAIPTLLIGMTIIASMIASIEHQTNSWKVTIALPISKTAVFASKIVLILLLMICSCILLGMATIGLGLALRFEAAAIPFGSLLQLMLGPLFAAVPFMALQMWLSVTIRNQAVPLTIGILGTVVSLFAIQLGDWLPLKWPYLINQWNEPMYSVASGLILGLLLYIIGTLHFVRKDVH